MKANMLSLHTSTTPGWSQKVTVFHSYIDIWNCINVQAGNQSYCIYNSKRTEDALKKACLFIRSNMVAWLSSKASVEFNNASAHCSGTYLYSYCVKPGINTISALESLLTSLNSPQLILLVLWSRVYSIYCSLILYWLHRLFLDHDIIFYF